MYYHVLYLLIISNNLHRSVCYSLFGNLLLMILCHSYFSWRRSKKFSQEVNDVITKGKRRRKGC